jgi:hypothetical protein
VAIQIQVAYRPAKYPCRVLPALGFLAPPRAWESRSGIEITLTSEHEPPGRPA